MAITRLTLSLRRRLSDHNQRHLRSRLGALTSAALLSLCATSTVTVITPQSASAQQGNWGGGARGTAAIAIGQRRKIAANQADLHAGPSVAYSRKGRIYQGEYITIIEVTSNQEWVRVSTPSGSQGWLLASTLERPQDQLAADPGRRRRQTEYQYDAQGRRLQPNGQQVGTGQGVGVSPPPMPSQRPQAYSPSNPPQMSGATMMSASSTRGDKLSKFSFELLPAGMMFFRRKFSSNIGTTPLSGLTSSSLALSAGAQLASDLNKYIKLDARFISSLGGEAPLPAIPSLEGVEPVQLQSHTYIGDIQVSGGVPLNDMIWIGGVTGAQYYELGYKAVLYPEPAQKLSPLQTHTYLSAILGARLLMHFGSLSVDLRGGGALPLMFDQAPNSEGQWKSSGIWSRLRVGFALNRELSLALSAGYIRYGSEYTGPAEQADYSLATPVYYTEASGSDESVEAQLSVRYAL